MKKRLLAVLCILAMVVSTMAGCTSKDNSLTENILDDNYRTFYEVFVYSFFDSDGDGIGDLKGLTQKLDYIYDKDPSTSTDLGCNGIWLMPIMPSTTYHKYDVIDYMDIDAQYGTMADFDAFMAQCQARDIHVLIDLVINHTSSEHPWFLAACDYLRNIGNAAPDEADCKYFGYYNFSTQKHSGVWYQVPGTDWYYEAPFWSGMPDLNLHNEEVRAEIEAITQFWFDKGVAGFRLDAAKEYESGANQTNVEILTWFNDMVKAQKEDAYIVAEVWFNDGSYDQYYASGIDSCFDFQFASQDGVIAQVLNGKVDLGAAGYAKKCERIQEQFGQYNANYINAPFYANHDMGRSAGYYAGETSIAKTKIGHAMNLLMSGSAFLYYGEELGMKGAGKDENKRLGMMWEEDNEAEGMCDGPKDADSVKQKFASLELQSQDPASVYNFVKQVLTVRNAFPAIARGQVEYMEEASNVQLGVMRKTYEKEEVILVFNLSAEDSVLDCAALADTLTIGGKSLSKVEPKATLYTGETLMSVEGDAITVPAYSVLVYEITNK
ncbi:MAG: alpha-amylase [Lachnospiraceae bacterium]|nr:alpha-amylase [Lachnospiraceae bacterium]